MGAFVTLAFQTRNWESRFTVEGLALPTGCADSYVSDCGDIDGAYLDLAIGRRIGTSTDRRGAWQVGIGPSLGPHESRFVGLYAERQVGVGRVGIARLGLRYRHGVAGEALWYGGVWPRIFALNVSMGLMGADR